MGPTTLATAARPAALPGRQLGRDASNSSLATARLARAARFARRGRRLRVALAPRALDRDRDGGIGGDGGELNMNVLAERMKALKAKEASENAAVVDAAIERDQAIVAGIRGDAAERPTPEPGEFDALIEHLLSTPMEAMEYESVRCASLMTKAFAAHVDLRMRQAAAQGPAGEETLFELQLLAEWIRIAREQQAERDDAARRRAAMDARGEGGGRAGADAALDGGVRFPTPVRSAGEKFRALMSAAADGVDALRAEIIDMARKGDVDDALMAMLTGNADNAEAAGDDGRAKFLRKVAEVCVRERNNANGGGA